MERCRNCGERIIKFPLWEGQGQGIPFRWDKVIWLNWFKVDMTSIILIVVIVLMVISYKIDIRECEEVITDPLKYCEESNACKIIEERKSMGYGMIDLDDIPKLDVIG